MDPVGFNMSFDYSPFPSGEACSTWESTFSYCTIVLVQPAPRLALKIQFMHLYMQYLFLWYDKNICG